MDVKACYDDRFGGKFLMIGYCLTAFYLLTSVIHAPRYHNFLCLMGGSVIEPWNMRYLEFQLHEVGCGRITEFTIFWKTLILPQATNRRL